LVALGFAYLLIVGCASAATMIALGRYDSDVETRRGFMENLAVVERLRGAFSDQETAQRGFIISGDQSFLEPYESARVTENESIATLRRDLQIHEPLAEQLDRLESTAGRWRREHAEPEIEARRTQGQDAASRIVATGAGRERFDELRSVLDTLANTIGAAAQSAADDAERARNAAAAILVASVASTAAVSVVSALLLRRWVVRPLEALTDAIVKLETDDNVAVPIDGPHELRTVSAAIDRMHATLQLQRDRAIRHRETIEQNALLTVQLGNELAGTLGDFPSGWSVATSLRAAEGLAAGDCYDVALLSPRTIGVVVLDIAGHGVDASILALKCKELLRAALRNDLAPSEAISWVAANASGLEDTFLTAFVARIDTDSGVITYANAGHPPALLSDGTTTAALTCTGPLIGPLPGSAWQTVKDVFPSGFTLVAYTDGLTEARDATNDFFGEERLHELVTSAAAPDAESMLDRVVSALDAFASRLRDDATILVISRA
jgi:sigma-B regulation protein RsbU (phosphoserine phosphatase)